MAWPAVVQGFWQASRWLRLLAASAILVAAMRNVTSSKAGGWTVTRGAILFALWTCIAACDFPKPPDVPGDDDGGAPTVVSASPAPHAAGVDSAATISVTFSEAIDAASAQLSVTSAGVDVQGTVVAAGATLTFRPSAALPVGAPFSVTVVSAADLAGNKLAAPYAFEFTTKTT